MVKIDYHKVNKYLHQPAPRRSGGVTPSQGPDFEAPARIVANMDIIFSPPGAGSERCLCSVPRHQAGLHGGGIWQLLPMAAGR